MDLRRGIASLTIALVKAILPIFLRLRRSIFNVSEHTDDRFLADNVERTNLVV